VGGFDGPDPWGVGDVLEGPGMSARDELTRTLVNIPWRSNSADVVADRILAAGYVKVSEAAVERAAKAVHDAGNISGKSWDERSEELRELYREDVRAVIAELREEA
jgi:hypothetical protein